MAGNDRLWDYAGPEAAQVQNILTRLDVDGTLLFLADTERWRLGDLAMQRYQRYLTATGKSADLRSRTLSDICREILHDARRELFERVVVIDLQDGRVGNVYTNIQDGSITVMVLNDNNPEEKEDPRRTQEIERMIRSDRFHPCY